MLLAPGYSRAESGIVAVFDIDDRSGVLAESARSNVVDQLIILLTQQGFRVVPKSLIRERLGQQKRESYRECYDQNCQIELGRELAAQKSLATVLSRIGRRCQLSLVLYDLHRAVTENAASVSCECTEESLMNTIFCAVSELVRSAFASALVLATTRWVAV